MSIFLLEKSAVSMVSMGVVLKSKFEKNYRKIGLTPRCEYNEWLIFNMLNIKNE